MKFYIAATAAILFASAGIPAVASAKTVIVSTKGINPATAKGQDRLNDRIAKAAKRVCAYPGDRALQTKRAEWRCAEMIAANTMKPGAFNSSASLAGSR